MSASPKIEGTCDRRFEAVRDALVKNFSTFGETGAAVAVTLEGKPVVDLWTGHVDTDRSKPWQRDTIANVFSTTKGMTAICAHRLVDQGKLDLEAPVVRYWPEFGQAGKDQMPVRMLLNHQAGLPAIRRKLNDDDMYNWETMASALAAQEPWWVAGAKPGYPCAHDGFSDGRSDGAHYRKECRGVLPR